MKFIVGLLLLISSTSFAASGSGNISNLCQGGGNFGANSTSGSAVLLPLNIGTSSLGTLKTLVASAYTGSSATGNFYGLYEGGTQYTVPNGKHLVLCGFSLSLATNANTHLQLGYATVTFANNTASASPPTGAVYYGAGSAVTDYLFILGNSGNPTQFIPIPGISFPPTSQGASGGAVYPFFRTDNPAAGYGLIMYGYEI